MSDLGLISQTEDLSNSTIQLHPEFEELALQVLDQAYNLARRLTRNSFDAEDLVQETYLKALRGFASFEPGTNFRAWILRILRNTFLSSRATLAHRFTVTLSPEDTVSSLCAVVDTPESLILNQTRDDAVWRAIDHVPPAYREVVLLKVVKDASYRQIADTLSIPIGTVMSRLSRGRMMLRLALRGNDTNPRLVALEPDNDRD